MFTETASRVHGLNEFEQPADEVEKLLVVSITQARSHLGGLAVLQSWCHSLDSRLVCITFDSLEQLRCIHGLLTGPSPFPGGDLFPLLMDVLHAKLDRRALVKNKRRFFKGTKLELRFAVRLGDDAEKSAVAPLCYKSAVDVEGRVCGNAGCDKKQPEAKLKLCTGCHGAKYCSPVCQAADWRADGSGHLRHRTCCSRLKLGGRWHPDSPAVIPAAIADWSPGAF